MATATIVPVKPIFLKECDVEIDLYDPATDALKAAPKDFAAACSEVTITPKTSQQSFQGMKKTAKFTDFGDPEWSATLTLAQDLGTGSLTRFLLDNGGKRAAMRFRPTTGAGAAVDVNVVLGPPTLGGKVAGYATTTATLGVEGQPQIVESATLATDPLGATSA